MTISIYATPGIWAYVPPYKRTQSARIKDDLNEGVPVDTVGAPRVFLGELGGLPNQSVAIVSQGPKSIFDKKLSCDMRI